MEKNKQTIEVALLQRLAPISNLSDQGLQVIRENAREESYTRGQVIFRRGDKDGLTTYLLSGSIELLSEGNAHDHITAQKQGVIRPLAHLQPRQFTATAVTPVKVLQVERQLLDQMLALEESGGYEVVELETSGEEDDWMSLLLQSELFQRIPTTNVQKIFQHVEKVETNRDEIIVRQGDPGDYYYFIAEGRCEVLRATASGGQVSLAELGPGDSFGEEALVSDAKRNATVRMLTDGVLMRMTQQDFAELIKRPVLREISLAEADALVNQGAVWLDVRLEDEHAQGAITGSLNVSLRKLRGEDAQLERGPTYIAYCDTGKRSAAAAFLMSEQGHDVRLLRGGLDANPGALAAPETAASDGETLQLSIGTAQGIGERAFQEDAFRVEPLNESGTALLAVVADGMGGHAAGDVASRLAIDTFVKITRRNYPTDRIPELLRHALLRANASIHDHVRKHNGTKGMGCTIVAVLIEDGRLWWISVGDSHLYILRDRTLQKANADHSYAGHLLEMEQSGQPIEPDPNVSGNVLMSALNGSPIAITDISEEPVELRNGDRLLLASDGLNTLSEGVIIQHSSWATSIDAFADNLLEAVTEKRRQRQDNTTLITIAVGAQPEDQADGSSGASTADTDQIAKLNEQLKESSRQLALALRHKAESEAAQQKAERDAVEQRQSIERQGKSDRDDLEARISRELEKRELQLKQASEALNEAKRQQQGDEQARLALEERFERLRTEETEKRKQIEAEAALRLKEEQARLEEKLSGFSSQIEEAQEARAAAEARLAEEQAKTEQQANEAAVQLAAAELKRQQAEQLRQEAEAEAERARAESRARDDENRQQLETRQQEQLSNLEKRLSEAEKMREAAEQARQQIEIETAQKLEEATATEARAREQLEADLRAQQTALEQRLAEAERERASAQQAHQDAEARAEQSRAEQAAGEAQARKELEERQRQELADLEQRLSQAEQEKEQTEQARLHAEAEARRQIEEAADAGARERAELEAQLQQQKAAVEQHLSEAERLRDEAERERLEAAAEAQRQLSEVAQAEAGVREKLEQELTTRQASLEQRLAEAEQVREAAETARQQAEQAAREQLERIAAEEAEERDRLQLQLNEQQSTLEQQLAEAERVREAAETARSEAEEKAREQLERSAANEAREREVLEATLREQQTALEQRLAEAEQAREKAEQERQAVTEQANQKLDETAQAEARAREVIEQELAARQAELEQRLEETARLRIDAEQAHQQAVEEARQQIQQLTEQEAEQRRQLEADLLQKQAGLEEQLTSTARELELARTRQQQAESERMRSEEQAEKLRIEKDAEQEKLRHEAEVRLQAERARMEQRFSETVGQLDDLQRKHTEAEEARLAAEEEIRNMRNSQQQAEVRARKEAEAQLELERQRITVEIRQSQRILDEARRQQEAAEHARAAAEEEASTVRAEHKAAGEMLRSELSGRLDAERLEFNKRLEEANEHLRIAELKAQQAVASEQQATGEAARIRAAEEAARMQLQAEVEQQLRTERELHAQQLAETAQRLAAAEQAQLDAESKRRQTEAAASELQTAMERAQANNEQERLKELQSERGNLQAELEQANKALQDAHKLVQSSNVDSQLAERRAAQLKQAEHDAAALKERARTAMGQARDEVRRLESELTKAQRQASTEAGRTLEAEQARKHAEMENVRIKGSLDNARQVANQFREREQLDRDIRKSQRQRTMLPILAGIVLLGALGGGGWYYRDQVTDLLASKPAAPPTSAPTPAPVSTPTAAPASVPATPAAPAATTPAPVAAPVAQVAVTPLGTVRDKLRDGRLGPVMVRLPAVTYPMGDAIGSGRSDELPVHNVTLKPFAIGRYEVSFSEYDLFVRDTGRDLPSDQDWGRGSNPAINITWRDAVAYADWLSRQTGHRYRLPSEAEWEFAARGGSAGEYWWNKYDEEAFALCADCNIRSLSPGRTTHTTAFKPNPFGLHQTAGNVQEWTADCYHDSYRGAPANGRAWTSGSCRTRVVRGGTFLSPRWQVRSSARAHLPSSATSFDTGFRLVREE